MNDLISRQWLMACVNEGWIKFDTEKDKNKFIHLIRDMAPSAQRWIPCSAEMPPTGKDVLVTLEGGTVTDGERWEPQEGKWFLFGGGVNGLDEDVLAWMPLPAPYRSEGKDDDNHD